MAKAKGIIHTSQLRDGDIVSVPARAFLGASNPSQKFIRALVLSPAEDREVYEEGEDLILCPIVTRDDAQNLLRTSAKLVEITDKQALGLPENEDYVVVTARSFVANKQHVLGRKSPNTIDHTGGLERDHPDWEKIVDGVYPQGGTHRNRLGYAQADMSQIVSGRAHGGLRMDEELEIRGIPVNRGSRGPRKTAQRTVTTRPDIDVADFVRIFDPSEGLKNLFNRLAAEKPGLMFTEALDHIETNRAEAEKILADGLTGKEPTLKDILEGGLLDAPDLKAGARIKKFLDTFMKGQGAEGGEFAHIKTFSDFITHHKSIARNDQPFSDWLFSLKGVGSANHKGLAKDIERLAEHFKGLSVVPATDAASAYDAILREAKTLRGKFMTEALAVASGRGTDELDAETVRRRYQANDGTTFVIKSRIISAPGS